MSLNIPLDVVENIIDTITQDDPKLSSTKACSLVCHSFLSICRKHIFGTVGLNSKRIHTFGGPLVEDLPRVSVDKFTKVLAASPVLCQYIRHLKYWIELEDLNDPALPETFRQLTHLRSLRILPARIHQSISMDWIQLRPMFRNILSIPSLENLHIGEIKNFCIADLVPCRNLSMFGFTSVTFSVTPSEIFPSTALGIHSLWFGGGNSSQLTSLGNAQCADGRPFIDISNLSHLSIAVDGNHASDNCRSFLRMCRNLISIEISTKSFGQMSSRGNFICLADLASMSTLKHLSIHIRVHAQSNFTDLYLGLHHQLEQMANKNVVESLTIKISLIGTVSTNLIAEEKWKRLDEVLGSSGWPQLGRVSLSIFIYNFQRADESNNIVKELKRMSEIQFPKLLSRNGMEFDFIARQTDFDSTVTES